MKSEALLLSQAKLLLAQFPEVYFVRVNTGLIANPKGRFYRSAMPGTPDLICGILGRFVAIELKSKKGKQSLKQRLTEEKIRSTGNEYWLINDIDALHRRVREFIRTIKT